MAITVTHPTAAIEPGDGDPSKIQPEDWNMNHTVVGTVDIANGGTGANSEAGARTNLGLGTIATQNSNNVSITGGSIAGVTIAGLDANTTFQDNVDPTKQMRFELSGVSAGQTRILTVPDFDGTVATLAGAESLTNKTLVDTTNLEVTNLKANDGTAAGTIADTTGVVTLASSVLTTTDINGGTIDGVTIGTSSAVTDLRVDNLRLDGNTISSTNTNGNVVIAPDGTGDVQLDADTVRIGDLNANATLTTNGTGDLILSTNSGTNSGTITIFDGTNGNIAITPNGTGEVDISKADIDGGTIDGTTIGGASAAAITGTAIIGTDATDATSVTAAALKTAGGLAVAKKAFIGTLLDLSTSTAGQIKFPATQNASADANTLDDYEEGTFTPAIAFGGASTGVTYSARLGKYTKIGDRVSFTIYISLTNKGSSTGEFSVTGLPFTSNAGEVATLGVYFSACNTTLPSTHLQAFIGGGVTSITYRSLTSGTAATLTEGMFLNSSVIAVSGHYIV